jgi:hypothetical protein
MCSDFVYNVWNILMLKRTEWDTIKYVYKSSCKSPFILVRFYWSLNFSHTFSKNTWIPSLTKFRVAEFLHADKETDLLFAILGTVKKKARDFLI